MQLQVEHIAVKPAGCDQSLCSGAQICMYVRLWNDKAQDQVQPISLLKVTSSVL